MHIEIWSDVVCPWCYLGKRRLEHALEDFEGKDQVTVTWRSFELDPNAPREVEGDPLPPHETPQAPFRGGPGVERLMAKYGMSRQQAEEGHARLTRLAEAEGLEYHLDRTVPVNTFDAHRLTRLAAEHGLESEAVERLFRAHFTEGMSIGRPENLSALFTEIGVPEAEIREVLGGDGFAEQVREEEALAAQFGAQGVPFFVLDRRYALSGAQPREVFSAALREAWEAGRTQ